MKVWITKYALTQGIFVADAEWDAAHPNMVTIPGGAGKLASYFHGMDWHRDWESAESQAATMVDRDIKIAKKKIAKLERLEFRDPSKVAA